MKKGIVLFLGFLSSLSASAPLKVPMPERLKAFRRVAKSLDAQTIRALNACAEKNTQFLKGKISAQGIDDFKNFFQQTFSGKEDIFKMPVLTFSFVHSQGGGAWSAIDANKRGDYLSSVGRNLLRWLRKNYTPQRDFTFFYLVEEPYYQGHKADESVRQKLNSLLEHCPFLIPCQHPDLLWTQNTVLIPDHRVLLDDSFYEKMSALLNSPTYESLAESDQQAKKGLVPFLKRRSKVCFRGALTGPKLPFLMENLKENPRLNLLTFVDKYPYLDVAITDWGVAYFKGELVSYLRKNFSHLSSPPVDFFEQAKNKYLLACDGYGSSWGRIALGLAAGSILFRNVKCHQYFHSLMENGKNYIDIVTDFSNLNEEFQRLECDPEGAQRISDAGKEFARKFFSKEAIDAYLWLVLHKLENCCQEAQ